MNNVKLLSFISALIFYFSPHLTYAQNSSIVVDSAIHDYRQYQEQKDSANSGTVGIITYFTGTYARFGADLANVLNGHNGVRVLSIMGHGSKQNIEDLLYLKGVDLALVMGDVLHYIANNNDSVDLRKSFVYITRLYPEEIHLIVRDDINSIYDLKGKKVSFGPRNSGTRITSVTTFNRLQIDVQEVNFDEYEGLKALSDGKISGMIFSDGKPTPVISNIEPNSGVKLITIPYETLLQEIYIPSTFTHDDYPNLIPKGGSIDTTAVPTVMIAYNWKEGSLRYNKLKNFVEAFFTNFDEFLEPQRHPKWKEVSLKAELPGWIRFKPAQDMIDILDEQARIEKPQSNSTASGIVSNKEPFERLSSSFEKRTGQKLSTTETGNTDALFKEFSKWLKQKNKGR